MGTTFHVFKLLRSFGLFLKTHVIRMKLLIIPVGVLFIILISASKPQMVFRDLPINQRTFHNQEMMKEFLPGNQAPAGHFSRDRKSHGREQGRGDIGQYPVTELDFRMVADIDARDRIQGMRRVG